MATSRSRFVFHEVGTNHPASVSAIGGSSHPVSDDEVISQFPLAPSIAERIFKKVLPLEASLPLVFAFIFDEGVR